MRALAVGLLLASGCNQIFGLHDNLEPRDSAFVDPFQDAMWWPMQLTWQVVADSGGAVTYPPIGGATVMIGPIDLTAGPMVNLPIDPDTGSFLLPRETPQMPYRLVYTVDSLPTEIQSTLHTGHFVVPMVGRIDREVTPPDALIEFNPASAINPIPNARYITVGLWTSADQAGGQITLPYNWDYQRYAVSMAGPQGSLRQDKGDLEIVCSMSPSGDVDGFAIQSVEQLFANGQGIATGVSTWNMPLKTMVKWISPNDAGLDNRFFGAVNNYAGTTKTHTEWGGVIPSSMVPNFVQPVPGGLDQVQIAPLSTDGSVSPHRFANPFTNVLNAVPTAYPLAAYDQTTSSRTVASTATLTSGFQGIGLPTGVGTSVDMHYTVGIAHLANYDVTLTPQDGTAKTLTGPDDTLVVAINGARLVDLTFGTDQPVDDCVVTIYKIAGANVTPLRRLLLQQPPTTTPFRIDASVFQAATTYTLGVVCRKGQPGVAAGDYTMVSYPYFTSTLYTPTFTVTP